MLIRKIRWAERTIGAAILARRYRHKIKIVARHLPIADDPGLKAAIKRRFDGYDCDLWHKVYSAASGRPSVDYVPEDLFYNVIENRLNPRHRKEAYKDKNHYDRLNWPNLPETIFRIINGRLFGRSYRMIDAEEALAIARQSELPEFVVKPGRESGGGYKIAFLDLDGLAYFLTAQLRRGSDWIVQRPIIQHEIMAALHASSVNTLRIITIRMRTEVSVVSAFVRIGTGRSRVDNLTLGKGIAVGVEQDGRLAQHGYDNDHRRCTAHPDHGYTFDSFVVPSFAAACQTCIALHQQLPELDLLSWDVAIDEGGAPVVLEVNIRRQDIGTTQVCSGPVFNPYVDSVLARHEWVMIPAIGAIDRYVDLPPEFAH